MNKIYEFIKVNGTYEKRYFGKEEPHLRRFFTFKTAISLFLNSNTKNIIETGCQRNLVDWGAGNSSLIFAETLFNFPEKGNLFSVDISPQNLNICHEVVKKFENSNLFLGDSIEFLKQFNEEIGLLYLDSFDYEVNLQKESQEHQLNEIKAAYNKLTNDSIILLDDNDFPNGGKTKLTKQFLLEENWKCVLDHQQSLWIKKL
jgi:predicted O-methyltransferase YrrM